MVTRALWLCPDSHENDFEAQGSISIVNKGQVHFLHKASYTISCVSFLVNLFINIVGCVSCYVCCCNHVI